MVLNTEVNIKLTKAIFSDANSMVGMETQLEAA